MCKISVYSVFSNLLFRLMRLACAFEKMVKRGRTTHLSLLELSPSFTAEICNLVAIVIKTAIKFHGRKNCNNACACMCACGTRVAFCLKCPLRFIYRICMHNLICRYKQNSQVFNKEDILSANNK